MILEEHQRGQLGCAQRSPLSRVPELYLRRDLTGVVRIGMLSMCVPSGWETLTGADGAANGMDIPQGEGERSSEGQRRRRTSNHGQTVYRHNCLKVGKGDMRRTRILGERGGREKEDEA